METTRLVTNQAPAPGPNVTRVAPQNIDEFIPELGGSIRSIRGEVNDAFEDMKMFLNEEPDAIMRKASGHSARLSYIRILCMRIEDWYRPARDLRIRELEPCIEELRFEWQNGSRLHSVRELDWKMEAGER